MAIKPAVTEGANAPKKKRGPNPIFVWGLVMFVTIVTISLPTVILVSLGMMPTLVAFIVDRSKTKNATFCVGGMNLCGVLPYVLDLWRGAHTVSAAVDMSTDVFTLLVMYGAASFGWMIFSSLPPIVGTFTALMTERHIAKLRETQKELIQEWGKEVALNQEDEHAA